jgi:hypothetical protein
MTNISGPKPAVVEEDTNSISLLEVSNLHPISLLDIRQGSMIPIALRAPIPTPLGGNHFGNHPANAAALNKNQRSVAFNFCNLGFQRHRDILLLGVGVNQSNAPQTQKAVMPINRVIRLGILITEETLNHHGWTSPHWGQTSTNSTSIVVSDQQTAPTSQPNARSTEQ